MRITKLTSSPFFISSKGGATLTAPRTGFNDPGLEALFSKNPKTDNATPGTTTNSGTDQTEKQNTESSSGSSSKVPIGPVVGAACGIVAIVCILIGAFLWHRKKKRRITASDDVINSAAYQQHPNNRKGLFGRKLDETEEHRLAAYGFSNKHELPQEGSRDVVPLRPELGSGEQMGAWTANQGRMQPATPEHWGHERYQENPSIPVEMWAGAPTPRLAPAELDSMGSNRTQTQTHGTRP